MKNYKTTVVKNNPDYVGKFLLLSNKNRNGLFKTKKNEIIQLEIDINGLLQCYFVKNGIIKNRDYSLRKIGIDFLGKKDPSVESILKYLIKPEMEIERIFNNIRFKYLQGILFSDIEKPAEKISADFNRAFQSFADIYVYQGNTPNRVDNDSFWKDSGFTDKAKDEVSFDNEKKELDLIIKYLRRLTIENYNRIYAELIAIKPGFHEVYIHSSYFDKNEKIRASIGDKDDERVKVFKSLRGYGSIENIHLPNLKPHQINKNRYLTYASCNVTEGPFVFRKKISVSYFDEIQKIDNEKKVESLNEKFHILDYFYKKPNTKNDLERFLEEAEKFKNYLNV